MSGGDVEHAGRLLTCAEHNEDFLWEVERLLELNSCRFASAVLELSKAQFSILLNQLFHDGAGP